MKRLDRFPGTVLLLVALGAMGGSLWNGFVYDDVRAIAENPRVTDLTRFLSIPSSTYWNGALWRPTTVAGYAVQWAISGGAPWLFHLVSVLGYWLVAWLLARFLVRIGVESRAALAAGVLFLVAPVHVEVVANVVGQAELWVGLALLAGSLLFVTARPGDPLALGGLLLITAGAATAKESGFALPLLLGGIYLLLPATGPAQRARQRELLIAVSITAVLLFLVRSRITGSLVGEQPAIALSGVDFPDRALTFLAVVPEYARLLLWPFHLQAEYGPPQIPIGGPFGPRHLIGLGVVIAVVWAVIRWRRAAPVAAFGLFWGIVTLAPVSNLLTATGIVMAERVLFLPSIGVALAAAVGIERHARHLDRRRNQVAAAVIALWTVALCARSIGRVPVWRNQDRFFAQLPMDAPRSYRAWRVSAEHWRNRGNDSLAERYFTEARRLWPHDPQTNDELGQMLRRRGDCAGAIPIFEEGVAMAPDDARLRARLVECLLKLRRFDDARRVAAVGDSLGEVGLINRVNQVEGAERTRTGG